MSSEIILITGPIGVGKSFLAKLLASKYKEGTLTVNEPDLSDPKQRRIIKEHAETLGRVIVTMQYEPIPCRIDFDRHYEISSRHV